MTEARLVRREGAVVEVLLDGPAHGPAIVLLPSLGRGAEDYAGVVPLLADAGLRFAARAAWHWSLRGGDGWPHPA